LAITRNNNNKITIKITTLKRTLQAMAVEERLSVLQRNNPHIIPEADCFLENLIGPQLVKKFPVFYENRRCIAAFIKPAISPYSEPDQSSPRPHPTPCISILILSSHLRLGFQEVSFTHVSPPHSCINFSSLPYIQDAPPI